MAELFSIHTDRVHVEWAGREGHAAAAHIGTPTPGRLALRSRRPELAADSIRVRVNGTQPPSPGVGPRLHEECEYEVFARAKSNKSVLVTHRDPTIQKGLKQRDAARSVYGSVNFRSQVGFSTFSVLVDGIPEFDFDVEVFPTKLDYQNDYDQLLAEVQGILSGLAFEYLRSTYQLGLGFSTPRPTELEWLLLLRQVAGKLESALKQIARRPIRTLTREPRLMRASRIKRVDSRVRAAVRRGRGAGELVESHGLKFREQLFEHRARPTLDTPEHRWLAEQLRLIIRRLGRLRKHELGQRQMPRRERALEELAAIETGLGPLLRLEPLKAAEGPPPPGFASLQLIGAPGYREAYQQCLLLSLGLRVEGGPLRLSVKDLSDLYEYWCYLAVLRVVSEELEQPVDPEALLSVRREGLRVVLERGRQTSVAFNLPSKRKVTVTYNPQFRGKDMLIPQQPDLLLSIENPGWPKLQLVLDAKYRVDASPSYVKQNGAAGPPQDALNVLHRYRDAILEREAGDTSSRAERTVIEAAALFPSAVTPDEFRTARLWKALDRIGVGAIPLLPDRLDLLREWLRNALARGGWQLAERAPLHAASERIHAWRAAAARPVLVGVLRGQDPAQHLEWIKGERIYYQPVAKSQPRQFSATSVALYSPQALRVPGAVTHTARIESIDVLPRASVSTPWQARDSAAGQVVYRLGEVVLLARPIENRGGDRVSSHRWSSELALRRARILPELLLETEPEWRLLEELRARRITFALEPRRPRRVDTENPDGRVWFVIGDRRLRYGNRSGFVSASDGADPQLFSNVGQALAFLVAEQAIVESCRDEHLTR
jgi:hypothetical protein